MEKAYSHSNESYTQLHVYVTMTRSPLQLAELQTVLGLL